MDIKTLETHVYVHSPLIEYSSKGGYYTSYAIHLMSNNPCFTRKASHNRRRYSEFVSLRELLASHYPTFKPPVLPPKNFFHRFSNDFIEDRMKGLEKFLKEVLAISVYLSDKSLHLFLQSSSTMAKIYEECVGDIPAPQLISTPVLTSTQSNSSSSKSSEYMEAEIVTSLHNLVIDDTEIVEPRININRTCEVDNIPPKVKSSLVSSFRKLDYQQYNIPKRNGSLESTPSSSPSSVDTSYTSSSSYTNKERRVSFNDRVTIAVVTSYGISILRS